MDDTTKNSYLDPDAIAILAAQLGSINDELDPNADAPISFDDSGNPIPKKKKKRKKSSDNESEETTTNNQEAPTSVTPDDLVIGPADYIAATDLGLDDEY